MRPRPEEIEAAVAAWKILCPEEHAEFFDDDWSNDDLIYTPDEHESSDHYLLMAGVQLCRRLGLSWRLDEGQSSQFATAEVYHDRQLIGDAERSGPGVALLDAYLDARRDLLRVGAWADEARLVETITALGDDNCPRCEKMPLLVEERGSFCARCGWREWSAHQDGGDDE